MELIAQGLGDAIAKLLAWDPDVRDAAAASLVVSGSATGLSVVTGVPLGALIGLTRFRGRNLLLSLVNTGMGLPPVVVGLTAIALQSVDPLLRTQLVSLGATSVQAAWLLIRESRLLVLGAAIAGFGAVISEIGASLMVGCNVKGDTRILTTAITLETSKGEFGSAFALAFILLGIIFLITAVTTWAQQRPRPA